MSEYSVRDVARLFDLQEARLRYWAQTGFVGPSVRRQGRFFYTFQDLIGIKVAKELLDRGLTLQSVRKSLESLRATLPHIDRPLTALRITADGDRVVVTGDDVPFEAHSGQVLMSFAVSALSQEAASIVPLDAPASPDTDTSAVPLPIALQERTAPARTDQPATAYSAFLAGVAAQDANEPARAESLYRRALELDENLAAAWTNLGQLLERRGQRGEARDAYQRALTLDSEQPEARYNLANLFLDAGDAENAIAEYRQVVLACPEFADAHYNLALLYDRAGAHADARAHAARYLDLDSTSEWAERMRAYVMTSSGSAPR